MRSCVATIVVVTLVLLSACAPEPSRTQSPEPAAAQPAQPRAPKSLSIGIQRQPNDFLGFAGSAVYGGVANVLPIVHDNLVAQTETGELLPMLAAEIPSLDKGTWTLNADGSMDTIWKLRPNVKWHDGTAFTSADLLFSFTVTKDGEVPRSIQGRRDLMQSASAPDPQTFVVRWSMPLRVADRGEPLDRSLPRHLLEEPYQKDKANFVNSPYLTTEFVGLGPYRLVRWEQGSFMEFGRFAEYYQGTPPFDSVTVRFLGDANTMVANILTGTVDVLLPDGVDIDAAVEVKKRWEGTGNEVRFDIDGNMEHLEIQYRPEMARPANGLTDRSVRQALYQALDRRALMETMTSGLSYVADSWIQPGDALRPRLESSIRQYPYDPARAQQLLSEAGWVRGADGTLVHRATGERFETQAWASRPDEEKIVLVAADNWKAVGVQVEPYVVPPALSGDRAYAATYTGVRTDGSPSNVHYDGGKLHSISTRSAANNWTGSNRAAYNNPRVDALIDRLSRSIDPGEQLSAHRDLLQEVSTDIALMPLYWEVLPVLSVKGVRGNKLVFTNATWNFFAWTRD